MLSKDCVYVQGGRFVERLACWSSLLKLVGWIGVTAAWGKYHPCPKVLYVSLLRQCQKSFGIGSNRDGLPGFDNKPLKGALIGRLKKSGMHCFEAYG